MAPSVDPLRDAIELPARLDATAAETDAVELAVLPVGRLLARVAIQAGPRLEERLLTGLSDPERQRLAGGLERMVQNVKEYEKECRIVRSGPEL